ncbi:HAD family hydrolase [Symbiobacterium terraclitae]|uniref:HAD family hydrolase n=1 Tax=Symbiobacterium terraclitae TaxID=557451 RepID=UPI0035B56C4B
MTDLPVRMLALDMDGTLLRSDETISPRNQAAVAACLERDIAVVLATGRFYPGVTPYLNCWPGSPIWVAACNGALLYAPGEDEPFSTRVVDPSLARAVVAWAGAQGVYVKVYVDDLVLVNRMTEETRAFMRRYGPRVRVERDLAAALQRGAAKILLFADVNEIPALERAVCARWGAGLEVTGSEPYVLELTAPGATKGDALRTLAERLGIDRRQVAAIGNERNDLSMILWAGRGATVQNANAAVREVAPRVVGHHDADGVAEFIESFLAPPGAV